MDKYMFTLFPKLAREKHHTETTNFCKYNNQVLRSTVSSSNFSGFASCFIAFQLWKIWGSRIIIQISAFFCLVGAICMLFSSSPLFLISGRILMGIGIRGSYQVIPQYASEMTTGRAEEIEIYIFQLSIAAGFSLSYLTNYFAANHHKLQWHLSFGVVVIPCIIYLLASLALKTPTGLQDSETEQRNSHWKELTKPCGYPSLAISIVSQVFQQLTGVNVVIFYAPLLFKALGLEKQALLSLIFIGVTSMVSICITILLVRKLGRKKVLLGSCLLMLFVLMVQEEGEQGQQSEGEREIDDRVEEQGEQGQQSKGQRGGCLYSMTGVIFNYHHY